MENQFSEGQTLNQQLSDSLSNDDQSTDNQTLSDQQKVDQLKSALQAKWPDYYQMLNQLEAGYQVSNCLKLLNAADDLLNQGKDLSQSQSVERSLIGGIKDNQADKHYPFDIQLLGDMQGFASFKKVIKADPHGLTKLMRVIPTNGPIDGWHFMQFIDTYKQWFLDNGFKQCHLFPATRLLTMKRPDQFFPLTEESLSLFCQALSIKPFKKQEFQRYWDDIIVAFQKTDWFRTDQPMDPSQLPLHRARVALLERLVTTPLDESQLKTVTYAQPVSEAVKKAEYSPSVTPSSTDSAKSQFIREERQVKVKKEIKQPKKMTINKRQSAKVNQNAATKLMSQYYFANKAKFAHLNMPKHRDNIVARLVEGESVEEVFESYLA